MNRHTSLRRAALALVVLAAIVACEAARPSAPWAIQPGAAARSQGQNGAQTNDATPQPETCGPEDRIVATKLIGRSGGTLVIGRSQLIVPAGALRDTVTITATRLGDGTSTVRFEPEGLRFTRSARLVLSGANCRLPEHGRASIVYLAPNGAVLETLQGDFDSNEQTVAASIVHFSGYAIAF